MKKILIVDDEKINRHILVRLLEEKYIPLTANNGLEALEIINAELDEISLILLDLNMPVMDGNMFIERFKESEYYDIIPIIVISADSTEEAEIKTLSNGASYFISKPFRADIVLSRIERILKLHDSSAMINSLRYDYETGVYNEHYFYRQARTLIESQPENTFQLICAEIPDYKMMYDIVGSEVTHKIIKYLIECMHRISVDKTTVGRLSTSTFVTIADANTRFDQDYFSNKCKEVQKRLSVNFDCKFSGYMIHKREITVRSMCLRARIAIDSINNKFGVYYADYDKKMHEKRLTESLIEKSMQNAIDQKEFVVYLQPKININNSKIMGAESLVRWISPEYGFMSPGDFIPLFEKNGFITTLDEYVCSETCRLIREWKDSGIKTVPVSINISRADLFNPQLNEVLLNCLEKYNLTPENLNLEITESAYTDHPQYIIKAVKKLKKVGFKIEMDDFGTGYSSLSMLSDLPIDILKIDMKFVQANSFREFGKNILSFIISLAKWLELKVIVEGVETEEQINRLRDFDCRYVQGYYFSPPMKSKDFRTYLCEHEIDGEEYLSNNSSDVNARFGPISDKKRTMLIVDDLEAYRKIIKNVFKEEFNTVEANNGLAAYNYLKKSSVTTDIIMLDLMMPIMDGFDLLELIKKDSNLASIPIIVVSQMERGREEKVLNLGGDDFIAKPFGENVLRYHVQNVLNRHNPTVCCTKCGTQE